MSSIFYVTLFSNSSMRAYPDNRISAFTVPLAHEIDLITHSWEMALCEFSFLPPKVGTPKPHAVFYDTKALIYWDLIAPQFVSHSKVRCFRTFIPLRPSVMKIFTPRPSVTKFFKTCISCRWKSEHFDTDNRLCREPDCLP